jgi:hypothetical protein
MIFFYFLNMEPLYKLLRMALSPEGDVLVLDRKLSDSEWDSIHSESLRHLVTAIVYRAINRLPKEQRPSMELVFQWASEAETVRGHNELLNAEAARLAQLFEAQGRKTAVLKGAANARLYPDPFMRHAGDIDLWVEGGRKSVEDLVKKMGYEIDEKDTGAPHHIHILGMSKVPVEIHFRPGSGVFSPFANRHLLRYLEVEILNTERVPEGFSVPSIKFALAMQLAHIQRHFFKGGVGLKQIVDYFVLLEHSTADDRREISAKLSRFGLKRLGAAVMWIMGEVFGLENDKMLVAPDTKRGKRMLAEVYESGNFGFNRVNAKDEHGMNFVVRWLGNRWKTIRLAPFSLSEVFWQEMDYCRDFIRKIPLRIKYRRISIWELYH